MKTPAVARRSQRKKPEKPKQSRMLCVPIPSRVLAKPSPQQEEKIKQATGYLNIYRELISHYTLTQTRQMYILRIVSDRKIPLQFQSMPLLRLIRHTVEEMMMNDIEIVVWAIYLDRFAWKEFSQSVKLLLYITAYAVKSYLSSSLEHFQAYLSYKFNNFLLYFNKWLEKSKNKLSTFPKDLNKKFTYLSSRIQPQEIYLINYNFNVDEILEMAPPYQHEGKAKVESQPSSIHSSYFEPNSPCTIKDIEGKEVESDEEGPCSPLLARLDSVFAMNSLISKCQDNTIPFETLSGSYGVNNSWMLENIEANKNINDEEALPQLNEQQSLFTYYLNQSLS